MSLIVVLGEIWGTRRGDTFDQSMAKGFVHVHGLSSKIAARRDLASDET